MSNALTDGSREILAEIEIDAREGFGEIPEGNETCDRCNGCGIEKLDPKTFDPIKCPCCEGLGYYPIEEVN